jgi:hypothetical protein
MRITQCRFVRRHKERAPALLRRGSGPLHGAASGRRSVLALLRNRNSCHAAVDRGSVSLPYPRCSSATTSQEPSDSGPVRKGERIACTILWEWRRTPRSSVAERFRLWDPRPAKMAQGEPYWRMGPCHARLAGKRTKGRRDTAQVISRFYRLCETHRRYFFGISFATSRLQAAICRSACRMPSGSKLPASMRSILLSVISPISSSKSSICHLFADRYCAAKSSYSSSQTKTVERAGMLVSWQICLSDSPLTTRSQIERAISGV